MLISTKHHHVLTKFVIDEASCHDVNGKTIPIKLQQNRWQWSESMPIRNEQQQHKLTGYGKNVKIKSPMITNSSYHFRKGPIRFSMLKNIMHCLKLTNIPMKPLNKIMQTSSLSSFMIFTKVEQENERTEQRETEQKYEHFFFLCHKEQQ